MDIHGLTSLGGQVWGSRTLIKATEICPLGAPIWIEGRNSHSATVVGIACTTGATGVPSHPDLQVILPSDSIIALRIIAQAEAIPQIEVLLAALVANAANDHITVTVGHEIFRVGSDVLSHGDGIVDCVQSTIHVHADSLEALDLHLRPIRDLRMRTEERCYTSLFESWQWTNSVKYKVPRGGEPAAVEAIRQAADHFKVHIAILAGSVTVSGLDPAQVAGFSVASGLERFISSVHPPIRLESGSSRYDLGNGISGHSVRVTQAECGHDLQCQVDTGGSLNNSIIRDALSREIEGVHFAISPVLAYCEVSKSYRPMLLLSLSARGVAPFSAFSKAATFFPSPAVVSSE